MATSFKKNLAFATLNIRGFSDRRRQYQLNHLLVSEQPDLRALQETKLSNDDQIERFLQRFLITYVVWVTHANGFPEGIFNS